MVEVQFLVGKDLRSIEVEEDTLMLDAALLAGVPVNYSCRRGDCEQCIGQLLDGEVIAADQSRPVEIDGEVLMCNIKAKTGLRLGIPYFEELSGIRKIRSPIKINAIHKLSETVIEVEFRLPPSASFTCLAGQYVRLMNKTGTVRSYSMAAIDTVNKRFSIHVRKVRDGAFSGYLFESAQVNDLLQLEGPLGQFFLRRGADARTIFLATGTGIAPIRAMLAALTPDQRDGMGKVSVYWGNRHRGDAYLADQLQRLCDRLNGTVKMLFSREPMSDGSLPQICHVQDAMSEDFTSLNETRVYACGSIDMIHAARAKCMSLGLLTDRFHADPFTAS